MRTPSRSRPYSLSRITPIAAALASVLMPAMGATYTVTNNLNSGAGSLSQAMQSAISTCDPAASIVFNMPGPFVISPSLALPAVANNCPSQGPPSPTAPPTKITIDGTTQPGASANSLPVGFDATNLVELDGGSYFDFNCVLRTSDFGYGAGSLALKGLKIHNFTYGGFTTAICGNLDIKGSEIYQNLYAISVDEPAIVGGPAAADRNVIGNNLYTAIDAQGAVDIVNNYIGTDRNGTTAAPNEIGISLFNGSGNTISDNLVASNMYGGISLNNSPNVVIANNIIGLDATKSVAMGNGSFGIDAQCTAGIKIQGNLISANSSGGVYLTLSDNAQITGNKVGVAGDGTTARPNGGEGILLAYGGFCGGLAQRTKAYEPNGSNNVVVSGNTIRFNSGKGLWLEQGGDAVITANDIRNNGSHGVSITTGTGNLISANSIWSNGGKNIDLDFVGGPLPNDDPSSVPPSNPPDQDIGPNLRQNHPKVLSVVQEIAANSTLVGWELYSTPSTSLPVEFYANSAAGIPAGQIHLPAPISANTDASGYFTTVTSLGGLHNNIAMLAIDPAGNTSEFSTAVALTPTPEVVMSPASGALTFPSTVAGASSSPQPVTLSSVGTAPYTISTFATAATCTGGPICSSGAFTCAIACSTSTPYAAGNSCSISVSFSPSVAGPASETFYVCDNAAGSPRSVTLIGTGVPPPPPTVSPASHAFGTFQVGTASASQTFTFTNPAPITVPVSGVTASGPFEIQSNTCGTSIAAGASCNVASRFVPVAAGAASGTLALAADSGIASASLSGSGTAIPPATLVPTSHDFGTVVVGTPSAPKTFTINNPAATSIPLSPFTVTPPFSLLSTTCTSVLAAGANCSVDVKFLPSATGAATGTVSGTAGSGTVTASLAGNGAATPSLILSPSSHDFGDLAVGSSSQFRFTVTNPASNPSAVSLPSASTPFLIAGTTCGGALPPAGTCNVVVAFAPFVGGPVSGSVAIDSSTGSASALLVGTGIVQALLSIASEPIDFGTLPLGTPPTTHPLTLRNTGNAPLSIQSVTVTSPFTLANACPPTLEPDGSCVVTVGFDPAELGDFNGSLSILTNATGGSRSLALHARVQPRPEPVIRVTPTSIGFGARLGLTQSSPHTITVVNEGGVAATGLTLEIDIADFTILNSSCGPVLAPRATCSAIVAFQPIGFGPRQTTLRVTSNAPTAGVSLSGAGCRPTSVVAGRTPGLNCAP